MSKTCLRSPVVYPLADRATFDASPRSSPMKLYLAPEPGPPRFLLERFAHRFRPGTLGKISKQNPDGLEARTIVFEDVLRAVLSPLHGELASIGRALNMRRVGKRRSFVERHRLSAGSLFVEITNPGVSCRGIDCFLSPLPSETGHLK